MATNKPVCEEWTLEALAEHFYFVHHHMRDHRYVWVLGAGASKSSGVPLGSELVDIWLRDLALRAGAEDRIEEWAETELQLTNLQWQNTPFTWKNRAAFYSQVYDVRFRDNPDEGYAFLESKLGGADPSPGYSILASILEGPPVPAKPGEKGPRTKQEPRHNAVITTNFDDLVADALAIYTDTRPFVCGHESLTGYVRVAMRRPLVCKIHRDLLTGPQNSARGLRRLHDAWGGPLRALLQHYTPIFIGYGGNDDSVMDLLESLDPGDIHGQPIWCYYTRDPRSPDRRRPGPRIQELIKHHNGVIVPTPDFDLLMILLGQQVGVEVRDEEIEQRAKSRAARYRERVIKLDTLRYPKVEEALHGIYQRSGGVWAWIEKAERQLNAEDRDKVYQKALQQPACKENSFLLRSYGIFLAQDLNDLDRALPLFAKDVELNPTNVLALSNLALCHSQRGETAEAEVLYKRGIEAEPNDADILGNYAIFLCNVHRDYEQAAVFYKRAIEADPEDARSLSNYAELLAALGRYEEAIELASRSIERTDKSDPGRAAASTWTKTVAICLNSQDYNRSFESLRETLAEGVHLPDWKVDDVFREHIVAELPAAESRFFLALADLIRNPADKVDFDHLLKERDSAKSKQTKGKSAALRVGGHKESAQEMPKPEEHHELSKRKKKKRSPT